VIEGPAEWSIDGENSATFSAGSLVARVPKQAVGFTLDTPTTQIVDLGTEFGVTIDDNGATQVHVYRGAVTANALQQSGHPRWVRLTEGQAIKVDVDGLATPQKFIRSEHAVDPALARVELRKPLAFYPFNGDARDASGNGLHATKVEQVEFVEGYEGQAARFAGDLSSFIELPVDASADACVELTWGAWIRPSKSIQSASEILSTDDMGYDRVLTIDNRLGHQGTPTYRFAAFGGLAVGAIAVDHPRPKAGQWTFLAAVYRQVTKTVALYVENPELQNGRGGLVSEFVGNAEIGSSYRIVRVGARVPTELANPGSFRGEIDNVFIFAHALGHKELEAIRTGGANMLLDLPTDKSVPDTTIINDQ
jgi:hypothetical protein